MNHVTPHFGTQVMARGSMVRQRGIILFVTLIALVILMISGIALVRSFDTSLLLAGNLAFKRDLINQGERGIAAARTALLAGGTLGSDTLRLTSLASSNYSATILASDARGLPLMLTDDSLWTMTGSDIVDNTSGVTIRYVIDRLCNLSGSTSTANCVLGSTSAPQAASANIQPIVPSGSVIYRVSIRVSGPRNTQSYMQSTLSTL
ncbi:MULTISPECIES: hypothetical protein [unclassified Undibacterium]|uniref:pilus assembly PilX family protein n=1 Tax=unclassified Undibacterium TaxID=2630295 RepID=UPI002AC9A91B|nr:MULTISPECIES: hypothetical protein [unclassified Undibacterium]MEB0139487.1 hypothetical protein [Undibacterium sp. CCC2.1]MEB0172404.1 hypothetical protein [Undibacterium sp. CCC1.1]MEB0175731.1 hypothetical protein [Undibacterium sp. CCC3.4]MEB0214519.1 hypothetical protein [Undibacterium sp. 5I2]WPX42914.1 hypothetical protein RHM61_16235 [Undibacterium sp. CCC3.4]